MRTYRSLELLPLSQNYACMKGKPRTVLAKEGPHADSLKDSPMGGKDPARKDELFFLLTPFTFKGTLGGIRMP